MCEAGLPPPGATYSNVDLEVYAVARCLWESQVLKKISLALRKKIYFLKDLLPQHCNGNFKWGVGFLLLCFPVIVLMLAENAEECCVIANNFNFDVCNSFLIRTTTYFSLEMFFKRVCNKPRSTKQGYL